MTIVAEVLLTLADELGIGRMTLYRLVAEAEAHAEQVEAATEELQAAIEASKVAYR